MANRYANIDGKKYISETYHEITEGFDAVEQDMDGKAEKESPELIGNPTAPTQDAGDNSDKIATTKYADRAAGEVQTELDGHIGSRGEAHANATQTEAGFMSANDKTKLNKIEDEAEKNQNAFAKVNDLEADNPSDSFSIKGGIGISVTENPNTNEVEITATSEAIPGAHGTSHLEFGADPIPLATDTDGGLMSAEDKASLIALESLPSLVDDLAGAGRTDETVKGNADALAVHQADFIQHENKKATDTDLGHVMVDGETITVDLDGKISAAIQDNTNKLNKTGDEMTGNLNMSGTNGVTFGGKFKMAYNANLNALEIVVI